MALWVKLGFTSSVHPNVVSGDCKHRGLRQCVALTSHLSPAQHFSWSVQLLHLPHFSLMCLKIICLKKKMVLMNIYTNLQLIDNVCVRAI